MDNGKGRKDYFKNCIGKEKVTMFREEFVGERWRLCK